VWLAHGLPVTQHLPQLRPVGVDARRVLLRDEGQLGIQVDVGAHMLHLAQRVQYALHHLHLSLPGPHRLDALAALQRIGRIGDHDPVPVPERRQLPQQVLLPDGRLALGAGRSEAQHHGTE